MARAATKKGKRAQQAPRPPKRSGTVGGSAKAVEQQLFFGRLRRSAKWAFALLAVVFAGTFLFLGVGSGQSGGGLLDIGHWFGGGGSSGPSVNSLQKKTAQNPEDAAAWLAFGQALQRNGQTQGAIAALKHYVALRPRSVDGLTQLAALYDQRAQAQQTQLQNTSTQASPLPDPTQFQPGGKLGQGLALYTDPFAQTIQAQASSKQAQLQPQLQQTRRDALSTDQQIASLTPDEPGAVEQVAIDALQVCAVSPTAQCPEYRAALLAFKTYLARFPGATDAAQVRKEVKAIEKQLAVNPPAGSSTQG